MLWSGLNWEEVSTHCSIPRKSMFKRKRIWNSLVTNLFEKARHWKWKASFCRPLRESFIYCMQTLLPRSFETTSNWKGAKETWKNCVCGPIYMRRQEIKVDKDWVTKCSDHAYARMPFKRHQKKRISQPEKLKVACSIYM